MTTQIRVLTWNVLYRDRETRLESLCDRIRTAAPDVLMLQESSPAHAAAVAEATGLFVVAVPDAAARGTTSVPALLAAQPLERPEVILLPSSHHGQQFAVSAMLRGESGLVQVCSTHLSSTHHAGRMGVEPGYRAAARNIASGGEADTAVDLPNELWDSVRTRLAQVSALDGALTESAVGAAAQVLCGDMNFVPDGPEYTALYRRGWKDSWRAAPRLGAGATILDRNPLVADGRGVYGDLLAALQPGAMRNPDYTLDFQFVRGTAEVHGAWTVGEPDTLPGVWPSDHLGIVVDYVL